MAVVATPAASVATAGIAVDPMAPITEPALAAVPAPEPSAPAFSPVTPPPPIPPLPPMSPVTPATPPRLVVSASTLLRAGFWIRLAASALDAVLVGLAIGLLPFINHSHFLLTFVVYNVVLWALKGATVGGIVCGLKVVRLDDRPLDWPTALVRALGGFLSFIVVGLGFIWVAFDDQKQSWHDKIAGTVVVHVPNGMSLV
jgi:uncharacterized RDD family membrane protein YckC